uniref:Uncharacterized protein n=1 Tax=Romanomermis culicivorax TaxID=13658 RepID=A0A915K851_ROMCU
MDWMLDEVKTNASIIHQGGQAQIIFTCSKQIKSCTRPPNQTQIRISQDHAVDDRTDVQATWKNGILEMKITFSEDLPFGEFTCICNGKNMIYHYLYRVCK